MEKMKYSIVIPCYKSSKTISKVVELTMGEMQGKEAEFILINDASPDGEQPFVSFQNWRRLMTM